MQEAYGGFIRVWFYHRYVILHTNIPTTNTYTVPALPIFVYAVRMYMHVCQASLAKPNILDQISGHACKQSYISLPTLIRVYKQN